MYPPPKHQNEKIGIARLYEGIASGVLKGELLERVVKHALDTETSMAYHRSLDNCGVFTIAGRPSGVFLVIREGRYVFRAVDMSGVLLASSEELAHSMGGWVLVSRIHLTPMCAN